MGLGHHADPACSADDDRWVEYLGGAGGAVGAGADHLARLELDRARAVASPGDAALGLDEVPRVDRGDELDLLVGGEEPLILGVAHEQLGGHVAEERQDAGAVDEVAAVVGVVGAHA